MDAGRELARRDRGFVISNFKVGICKCTDDPTALLA
jgi:hypothetical protein